MENADQMIADVKSCRNGNVRIHRLWVCLPMMGQPKYGHEGGVEALASILTTLGKEMCRSWNFIVVPQSRF